MNITKTANSITIELTGQELAILSNDLIDPFVWFERLAREKLANCQSRLITEWTGRLRREKMVASIPTDEQEMLDVIFAQPGFKPRKNRPEQPPGLQGK